MKKITKETIVRLALLLGATVVVLLVMPRNDTQSYTYEMNQPWRYNLLMADFDIEVKRDSMSAQRMRDSIDHNFVPIMKRKSDVADKAVASFSSAISGQVPPQAAYALSRILREVYARGVVDARIYNRIQASPRHELRIANRENGADALITIDAAAMMSPAKAFEYIDSAYRASGAPEVESHNDELARELNSVLVPDIVLDTVADTKFRSQEYLAADASIGVIKKGQRIVDQGEIVSPQIYTNLNTYLQKLEDQNSEDHSDTYFFVGQGLFILICFIGLFIFLRIYRSRFFHSIKKMTFLTLFITLFVIFAVVTSQYFNNGIYLVPFAVVPVIILVFFDARTAIFSLLVTVMISSLVAIYPLQFIFLELVAGIVAAFSINTLERRSQLLNTAFYTFLAYIIAYFTMRLIEDGTLQQFDWHIVGKFAINALILSFVYVFVFLIEKVFGFTSTVTLVELSDINNPLLRRLAEEAPGTFQHSMQVSSLAAEAARAINANTQLVRTGALYHDIGKLEGPVFFTENQHGVNPHEGLDPEVSARKIISHVTQGLVLAAKAKLPQVVKDFIPEHHGKSVTRYFYNTAVNNTPEGRYVDKSKYTYPGPNPRSKETTILMMADSVEAASRSLKDHSPEAIDALVDKIIDSQAADGLYNDSPLSFKDIDIIKSTFKKRLATLYHSRVAYPELKGGHTGDTTPAHKNSGSAAN